MANLPIYVSIVFILTTLLTLFLFFKAVSFSKQIIVVVALWVLFQGVIGITGFYTNTNTFPPRFLLLVLPPIIAIVILFSTTKGRVFTDRLDIHLLTLLHIVRIPVELVLYWQFLNKQVPIIMTFEGRNFDIISGLTAPLIYYFGFMKERINKKWILIWNFICLALLVNIVITAILSAPFTFQKLAFDQPDIGILYFPFIWLPGVIVPIVLFSHLVSIRVLIKEIKVSASIPSFFP